VDGRRVVNGGVLRAPVIINLQVKGTSKNAELQPSLRDLLLFLPDFPPLSWRAESIRPSGTEFLEVP
jgi:hypothetical protein